MTEDELCSYASTLAVWWHGHEVCPEVFIRDGCLHMQYTTPPDVPPGTEAMCYGEFCSLVDRHHVTWWMEAHRLHDRMILRCRAEGAWWTPGARDGDEHIDYYGVNRTCPMKVDLPASAFDYPESINRPYDPICRGGRDGGFDRSGKSYWRTNRPRMEGLTR